MRIARSDVLLKNHHRTNRDLRERESRLSSQQLEDRSSRGQATSEPVGRYDRGRNPQRNQQRWQPSRGRIDERPYRNREPGDAAEARLHTVRVVRQQRAPAERSQVGVSHERSGHLACDAAASPGINRGDVAEPRERRPIGDRERKANQFARLALNHADDASGDGSLDDIAPDVARRVRAAQLPPDSVEWKARRIEGLFDCGHGPVRCVPSSCWLKSERSTSPLRVGSRHASDRRIALPG